MYRIFQLAEIGVLVTGRVLRSVHTYRELNVIKNNFSHNISWKEETLHVTGYPDVSNKKAQAMNNGKVVTKNHVVVIRRHYFEKMKSGTTEHGLKINMETFTTLLKRYVGCLLATTQEVHPAKDVERLLLATPNMAKRYVKRRHKQQCFTNQKVVKVEL